MNFAANILSRIRRSKGDKEDMFDLRLRSMMSPASTGPRLRRIAPPALFGFRTRGHA